MTIDERLIYLASLQPARREQLAKMAASAQPMDSRRDSWTTDAINRLTCLVENHENRIDNIEGRPPS